jgi:hypothetical protein
VEFDTGFRPSEHGLAFTNRWRDTMFGVIASRGRCGGMVFSALDAFLAGRRLPDAASPGQSPAHDSSLARHIARRQLDSVLVGLGANLWRFVVLTYLPTGAPRGVGVVTRRELLRLFDALRAGRPVPLGLVSSIGLATLVQNHQVLAYGAHFGEAEALIRIYDPNLPGRDDVVLAVPITRIAPVVERAGGWQMRWRGFFVERYSPKAPPSDAPAV